MDHLDTGTTGSRRAGNPLVEGWYADPEARIFEGHYWIYPTYSAPYEQQTFLDAFWSADLLEWHKVERILDIKQISWAEKALWAPSTIEVDGRYYLYFCANDIQSDAELGGIGVAVAERPEGPFRDALGHPLIDRFHHGAQPIDPHVFMDDEGQAYLYYGGWGHCNVVKLNADMVSLGSFDDGEIFKSITPQGYVEGPCMFKRGGEYYFMWAEGGWGNPDYSVAYARSSSPLGPFSRIGKILEQHPEIATSAGHHGVFVPDQENGRWWIVYHRRPLGETNRHHRVLAMDQLVFDQQTGNLLPVQMT
ncbi:arabinan endo-1,5-alpha-L-arabinosidase [Saccharibacillus sp. O16]|nr:arabinan endo-1,5-alpha-L-arabinosidase [Saccharibacillus sp. O16]